MIIIFEIPIRYEETEGKLTNKVCFVRFYASVI